MIKFLRRRITFQKQYLVLAFLILITEILIAVYAHDKIIRPYIGDFLVVILIYCFLKSFLDIPVFATAIAVLLFSYTIEILQYFNLADRLGFHNSKLAKIIIGSSFEWIDMIAYTAGIAIVLFIEKKKNESSLNVL